MKTIGETVKTVRELAAAVRFAGGGTTYLARSFLWCIHLAQISEDPDFIGSTCACHLPPFASSLLSFHSHRIVVWTVVQRETNRMRQILVGSNRIGVTVIAASLLALDSFSQAVGPSEAPYAVVSRDANQRVWERTEYETQLDGSRIPSVHQVVELSEILIFFGTVFSIDFVNYV